MGKRYPHELRKKFYLIGNSRLDSRCLLNGDCVSFFECRCLVLL